MRKRAVVYLEIDDVVQINQHQIAKYGGLALCRDLGLLASAVAQPRSGFGGEERHPSLFDKAAAYLFHIARNHPFGDGNKRTAADAAFVFLGLNGITLDAPARRFEDLILRAAQGHAQKPAIADFLERWSKARRRTGKRLRS